ncbi:MAG: TonB-dependent receptor [Bacteroidetes bacterium]|nr:MAG: TonB-dependent receptor [Bacteroidota bacterium]
MPQYAVQTDAFTRALLTWKRKTARTETQARLAWLNERIEYQDSVSKTDSRSRARTLVGELEVHARPYPGTYLEAGWQSLHIQAFTNTYGSLDPVQYRQAAYASWQQQLFRERAQASLSLRQEWRRGAPTPLMPAAGISYRLTPRLSLSARGSRNYRLPTLNDLYWNPGGNPNLRPEDSWSAEAGATYSILPHPGKWRLSGQSQLYSSRTRDWIIWLPEGSYWTPQNLQRVWARGIEQAFHLERDLDRCQLFADLRYTYCRSTQQQAIRENDASLHKQLIYVPVHQGHINLGVTGKSYTLIYEQGFTGKRFTSSDNYGSLPAFATGNLFFSLQKCLAIPRSRKIALGISLRCDNLWNARYQVVAGRPMPGRNYLASLSVRGAGKS